MPRKTQKRRRGGKGLNPSKLQGGMSTSEWGVKTFGEMGQQHAIPGSNILQVNAGVGGQPQPQAGGSALMATVLNPEVLTPVVLTLASNVVGKKMGKSRKMRGGNVMVPAMLVLANHTIPKLLKKGKKVKGGTVRKVPMAGGSLELITIDDLKNLTEEQLQNIRGIRMKVTTNNADVVTKLSNEGFKYDENLNVYTKQYEMIDKDTPMMLDQKKYLRNEIINLYDKIKPSVVSYIYSKTQIRFEYL